MLYLYLAKFEFHRSIASEEIDCEFECCFLLIDFDDFSFTSLEWTRENSCVVTDFDRCFVFSIFLIDHSLYAEKLSLCHGHRSCTSAEESCDIWSISHDIPWLIGHYHLYEDVSWKDVFLILYWSASFFQSDYIMKRNKTIKDIFLKIKHFSSLHEWSTDIIFCARDNSDDIPFRLWGEELWHEEKIKKWLLCYWLRCHFELITWFSRDIDWLFYHRRPREIGSTWCVYPASEPEESITEEESQQIRKDSHTDDNRYYYLEKSLCFYMSRPYDMLEFCYRFFEKICHKKRELGAKNQCEYRKKQGRVNTLSPELLKLHISRILSCPIPVMRYFSACLYGVCDGGW